MLERTPTSFNAGTSRINSDDSTSYTQYCNDYGISSIQAAHSRSLRSLPPTRHRLRKDNRQISRPQLQASQMTTGVVAGSFPGWHTRGRVSNAALSSPPRADSRSPSPPLTRRRPSSASPDRHHVGLHRLRLHGSDSCENLDRGGSADTSLSPGGHNGLDDYTTSNNKFGQGSQVPPAANSALSSLETEQSLQFGRLPIFQTLPTDTNGGGQIWENPNGRRISGVSFGDGDRRQKAGPVWELCRAGLSVVGSSRLGGDLPYANQLEGGAQGRWIPLSPVEGYSTVYQMLKHDQQNQSKSGKSAEEAGSAGGGRGGCDTDSTESGGADERESAHANPLPAAIRSCNATTALEAPQPSSVPSETTATPVASWLTLLLVHPRWVTDATDLLVPWFEEESGVSPECLEQMAYLRQEVVEDELEEEADVLLRIKDTYLLLVGSRCCCYVVGRAGGEKDMVEMLTRYANEGEEGVGWFRDYQRVRVNRLWEFERGEAGPMNYGHLDGIGDGGVDGGRDGVMDMGRNAGKDGFVVGEDVDRGEGDESGIPNDDLVNVGRVGSGMKSPIYVMEDRIQH